MGKSNTKGVEKQSYAKIITVFNQKGGAAKTGTAMQLAGTLGLRGHKVIVADMDIQGTASRWSACATVSKPFPATVVSLHAHSGNLGMEIRKMVELYEFIIIDCPPAIGDLAPWAALQISDLAIIPIIPLMDNIWSSSHAKELALKAQQEKPDLKIRVLPTKMQRGKVFDICLEMLEADEKIPVFSTRIYQRNAYPESQIFGTTVHARGNQAATKEVEALTDEVLSLLGEG